MMIDVVNLFVFHEDFDFWLMDLECLFQVNTYKK